MAALQGIVGQQGALPAASTQTASLDKQGGVLVSELHGRYYQQAYSKNVFSVAIQSVATTTVGLATTYTGLVVSNTIGSPVNLVMLKASMMQSVIQATQPEAFALAAGFNNSTNVTHTAAITPQSTFIGSGVSAQAKADTSATLPTAPVYLMFGTNTPSATTNAAGIFIDLEGSVIIPPGGYICWVTPAQASVAGMWFNFQWEEVLV